MTSYYLFWSSRFRKYNNKRVDFYIYAIINARMGVTNCNFISIGYFKTSNCFVYTSYMKQVCVMSASIAIDHCIICLWCWSRVSAIDRGQITSFSGGITLQKRYYYPCDGCVQFSRMSHLWKVHSIRFLVSLKYISILVSDDSRKEMRSLLGTVQI